MTHRLHILNASGMLSKYENLIQEVFESTSLTVVNILNLENVDTVVRSLPEYTIPEIGIGGFTPYDGSVIYISLDPKKKIKKIELIMQFVHEYYHCARFKVLKNYTSTLGNDIVNEGLACLFEEEITGEKPIYCTQEYTKKEVDEATQLFLDQNYDRSKWMFGKKGVSRWFVYSYGYDICKRYITSKNLKSSDIYGIESSMILSQKS